MKEISEIAKLFIGWLDATGAGAALNAAVDGHHHGIGVARALRAGADSASLNSPVDG